MTPTEIQDALAEFSKGKGEISAHISIYGDDREVGGMFWPDGIVRDAKAVFVKASSFEGVIEAMHEKWDEIKNARAATKTKDIALAIIRITHEQGRCTDAALRADFSASDIADYGKAATALANEMGERGPFSIVETAGANAA